MIAPTPPQMAAVDQTAIPTATLVNGGNGAGQTQTAVTIIADAPAQCTPLPMAASGTTPVVALPPAAQYADALPTATCVGGPPVRATAMPARTPAMNTRTTMSRTMTATVIQGPGGSRRLIVFPPQSPTREQRRQEEQMMGRTNTHQDHVWIQATAMVLGCLCLGPFAFAVGFCCTKSPNRTARHLATANSLFCIIETIFMLSLLHNKAHG